MAELLQESFETITISPCSSCSGVYYIYINLPHSNALTLSFFSDLRRALSLLSTHPTTRTAVISSRGPHFSSGIYLPSLLSVSTNPDPSRLQSLITTMQDSFTEIEKCSIPVIAEMSGACIGGAVELALACDLRFCDESAFFALKEVDVGLAADLGALQRLPRIVGFGNAMDLVLTGRKIDAVEAKRIGLVSRVFSDRKALEENVAVVAKELAEKSPAAVTGTKAVMLRSRDLSIEQGLKYVAAWNAGMLKSPDLQEAVSAHLQKRKPVFSKL